LLHLIDCFQIAINALSLALLFCVANALRTLAQACMSRNQREHTTEGKLISAETISDQITPVAGDTKERPKRSAVKPNGPPTAQALSVREEHPSGKTAPRLKLVKNDSMTSISLDHPNQSVAARLLMQALGTADVD
jgi:hypothetical protein